MPHTPLSRRHIFLRILLPFALGYYLSYFYRVVNAVLSTDLARDLGLGPDALGLLTASYFITFAAAQLPLGLLLDRYGPRRIESLLLLFAALGALLFARGESGAALILGRGLIGLGVSACLMAAFKAFTLWFPPERLPLVNGVIMASGGLGALTATAPVQQALAFTDWRGVFLILSGVTLAIALAVFLLVPEQPVKPKGETFRKQLSGIRSVFTDRFFWRVAPLSMLSQASFISIQSLWAGPWLQDVAHLSPSAAADVLLSIAAAMMAGFLGMGLLAERLGRLGIRPARVAGTGMFLFILTQGLIALGPAPDQVPLVWMLFGFFGTAGIIQYAALSQHFPHHLAGRVNTAINLLVFIAAFCLQWASGAIIDLWPQLSPGHYQPQAYRVTFGILLALQATAFLWFLVPHNGRARQ
ncbi:MAG TPA: MFS transporter [Sedimenticola sp.]|nr:MFS transporter [Sedimenticola sp.]